MTPTTWSVLVAVGMSCFGIIGDYFLKRASAAERPLLTRWFAIGLVLYASTAFAWVFVMRHLKLATIGVIYSLCMILLLTGMGVFLFGEKLHPGEIVGILLAIASLVLLSRFG
jgi:multidrug transporter EmrE-like cation transporter